MIKKEKPFFIEFKTYRYLEHCGPNYDNHLAYRSQKEYDFWKKKDPIELFKKKLSKKQLLIIQKFEKKVTEEIHQAFLFAEKSKFPEKSLAFKMYMPKKKYITFSESINQALDFALKKDKKLFCYGLGINDPKGIFGTTIGLSKKYGKAGCLIFHVLRMPNWYIYWSCFEWLQICSYTSKIRFFLLAMDQLVNAASKWHYLYGNKKININNSEVNYWKRMGTGSYSFAEFTSMV